jgi:opacity protein-like surface antigen
MKRSIFFILLFTLFIIKAQAQGFHAGFMLGPAITDIDGADLTDNDNDFHKLGFSIGGLVDRQIGKHAFAQMELAFIQKGSSQPADLDSAGRYLFIPYTINLNYLDISLLVKQGLGYSKKSGFDKFGVEVGLTMGDLVGSSFKDSTYTKQPININKFDLELLAGVYYNFTPGFYLDVRYSNSIIHAIPHQSNFQNFYPYFTMQKGNNLVFQLTLGFVFGNKKH